MSQQNVEIVRETFDREARRDRSVIDLYDPEVEMDFSASPFADFHDHVRTAVGDR